MRLPGAGVGASERGQPVMGLWDNTVEFFDYSKDSIERATGIDPQAHSAADAIVSRDPSLSAIAAGPNATAAQSVTADVQGDETSTIAEQASQVTAASGAFTKELQQLLPKLPSLSPVTNWLSQFWSSLKWVVICAAVLVFLIVVAVLGFEAKSWATFFGLGSRRR
ncbi:MAG: hypothetical protein ACYCWW_00115 [Deltaproteobacteria bacterium]